MIAEELTEQALFIGPSSLLAIAGCQVENTEALISFGALTHASTPILVALVQEKFVTRERIGLFPEGQRISPMLFGELRLGQQISEGVPITPDLLLPCKTDEFLRIDFARRQQRVSLGITEAVSYLRERNAERQLGTFDRFIGPERIEQRIFVTLAP
ncbi:MAG TPA: hypothetical protein VFV38_18470 [Ktedonobacteraceae bacterium]|nr:hypothetical protein [Ktedonobacteraceae bacterium]